MPLLKKKKINCLFLNLSIYLSIYLFIYLSLARLDNDNDIVNIFFIGKALSRVVTYISRELLHTKHGKYIRYKQ